MGFLSSWAVYFPTIFPKTFFPSVFDIDADKNVLGLSSQWIYDKLISDSVNGVWLSSYANSMKDSVKLALKNGGQRNWIEEFKNSSGYQVGQALYGDKGLFSTKNGLIIWYPWKESMKHAIISSPYPFAPGSSLSHLDSFVYSSVASFLMRPSATSFVKFESVNPGSGNPFGSVLLGIMRGMGYVVRQ